MVFSVCNCFLLLQILMFYSSTTTLLYPQILVLVYTKRRVAKVEEAHVYMFPETRYNVLRATY